MCGLFGYVAADGKKFSPGRMEAIVKATETRGPHAFGFSWIDSRGRLRMFKRQGRATEYLGALSMARDAKMLIGHCRYATHGGAQYNINNHPHPSDAGWIVHNGVIGHHEEINEGYMLSPVSKCDSETLAQLIEEFDGPLPERVAKSINVCATSPLAMMGLWRSPQRLVATRTNGQPLHIGTCSEGTYLASLPVGLPGARPLVNDSVVSFDFRDGQTRVATLALSTVDIQA